jgi:hypothetical protein
MTPDNGGYAIAAYVAALVIFAAYALVLVRRQRALERARRPRAVPDSI